mmetsp:Transcript_14110/g.21424  ORF Transcript_14110/g.21424 Transcript_14110/m.21424 type:complete len:497 (+) Transcript_14110:115-1605(+)
MEEKKKVPDEKEKKKRRKQLHRVLKSHPEFELTLDMQTGIRHVLGMEQGGVRVDDTNRPPRLEDFDEQMKIDFPAAGSTREPFTSPHSSRDFKFKTYAPKIFRRIRERFGISTIEFITSICGNFEYLSFKTNSKSGQFFFYSYDKRYMLKTMTNAECKLLLKILPSYYQHVMKNPNTLLCRFYGMHRVRPAGRLRAFHFLIMESVFNTDLEINQIFDLKGSKVNRFAKRGESVFKDIDFLENNFSFQLNNDTATKLKNVITKDAEFLKEQQLMDYSLLVGIHYKDGKKKQIEYVQDRRRRLKDKKEKKAEMNPVGVPKKYNIISEPKKANVKIDDQHGNTNASIDPIAIDDQHPVDEKRAKSSASISNIDLKAVSTRKKSQSVQPAHHGGLQSVNPNGTPGNQIYYIGIIDILTEYGVTKGIEHFVSSIYKDGNWISCVPAGEYGNRFEDFLCSRIEAYESNSTRAEKKTRKVSAGSAASSSSRRPEQTAQSESKP